MRPSPSQASEKLSAAEQNQSSGSFWHFLIILSVVGMSLTLMSKDWQGNLTRLPFDPNWNGHPVPLAMRGGDPYIRALMRTISVSESSDPQPYSIVYGGDRIQDLSRHPDRCIPIVAGPNVGDCTTAAGRYQFLTTTWLEKAREYHSQPPCYCSVKPIALPQNFRTRWFTIGSLTLKHGALIFRHCSGQAMLKKFCKSSQAPGQAWAMASNQTR